MFTQEPMPPFAVVCLSHLRWDFVWQRPQQLLTRVARDRRVILVEEPLPSAGHSRLELKSREEDVVVVVPLYDSPSGAAPHPRQKRLQGEVDVGVGAPEHASPGTESDATQECRNLSNWSQSADATS